MNGINQVILEGNVVRAPEFRDFSTGSRLCLMPIAVNRVYKDRDGKDVNEVGYYDVEAWGESLHKSIEKNGFKGRGVRVVGRLKQNRWKSDDGKMNSKVYVVAEHVEFKFMKKKDADVKDQTNENDIASAAQGLREEVTQEEVF